MLNFHIFCDFVLTLKIKRANIRNALRWFAFKACPTKIKLTKMLKCSIRENLVMLNYLLYVNYLVAHTHTQRASDLMKPVYEASRRSRE